MVSIIFYILASLLFLFFAWFAIVSIIEKELLAAQRSLILAFCTPISFIAVSFLPTQSGLIVLSILLVLLLLGVLLFFLPIKTGKAENEISSNRIDERDTMFSRLEITRSSEKTELYYAQKPHLKTIDKEWQVKPGLASTTSAMYEPKAFAAADASFDVIGALRNTVVPEPAKDKQKSDIKETTTFIKQWAKKLGAVDVGICELKPHHFYSHRGRGAVYGKEVDNNHRYGIAITVEMNKNYLAAGPAAPTLMESAQQYLNSGTIALQIAHFIANMGYSARAHIDGNYEVICPLVGRDAGLGEIGRMGLLMTPSLGPRVRLAIITTDIPLVVNERNQDTTVHDFCSICKKCADICPSQAISKKPKKVINNIKRWQISQEKCFRYWCTTGTDCGRCMSVCPYSHPDNLLHNIVRWGIKKSWIFRRVALWMDDFFYGRKPKPKKMKL